MNKPVTDLRALAKEFKNRGFDWFINEYLPSKGQIHMQAFIDLSFSPYNYFIWLAVVENQSIGKFKKAAFRTAARERIIEVFGRVPEYSNE